MSYVSPPAVVAALVDAGAAKVALSMRDVLIRGFLAGAFLGCATTLAATAIAQTGLPIAGAAVFPIGLIVIVLLGLELLTGNFATVPMAVLAGRVGVDATLRHWAILFATNLAGALAYALLFHAAARASTPATEWIVNAAEARTLGYADHGARGMLEVFTRAVLCNWLVTTAIVLAVASTSTTGKVLGVWMPIFAFVALGFEHAVVSMFLIPMGMLLGADVSFADWWLWNQLPVTLGNLVGGFLLTAVALMATHGPRRPSA